MTDWEALRATAQAAMAHCYVPYSKFPVGAAALVLTRGGMEDVAALTRTLDEA